MNSMNYCVLTHNEIFSVNLSSDVIVYGYKSGYVTITSRNVNPILFTFQQNQLLCYGI